MVLVSVHAFSGTTCSHLRQTEARLLYIWFSRPGASSSAPLASRVPVLPWRWCAVGVPCRAAHTSHVRGSARRAKRSMLSDGEHSGICAITRTHVAGALIAPTRTRRTRRLPLRVLRRCHNCSHPALRPLLAKAGAGGEKLCVSKI